MRLLSLVLWIWSSEKLIGSRSSSRKESEEGKLDAGDGTVALSNSGANFLLCSQCTNSK